METNKKEGQNKKDGLLIFGVIVLPLIVIGILLYESVIGLIYSGLWIPIVAIAVIVLILIIFGKQPEKAYRPGDKEFEDKELY